MAESRHPPAEPGADSVDKVGQDQDQGHAQTDAPPAERQPIRRTKTYGPPALPPPLRPVGPGGPVGHVLPPAPPVKATLTDLPPVMSPHSGLSAPAGKMDSASRNDDEREEETTVDPQASKSLGDPASLLPDQDAVDPDQKSTTTEAISHDSNVLLERAMLDDHLAAGTGETGGGSVDEPTQDEGQHAPALQLVRGAAKGGAMGGPARIPSVSGEAALSPAWLVVQSGTDRGRRFALRNGRTSVGRGVDNDVVLTDIAVSRKHLTIDFDGGGYSMNDLGSGNGTLVNDRDEDGLVRLGHGDKLELGNTVLVFECTVAQPHGKWSSAHDEDELSTVAGHKAGKVGLAGPADNGIGYDGISVAPTTVRTASPSGPPPLVPPPPRPIATSRPTAPGTGAPRPPMPLEPSSPFSARAASTSPPLPPSPSRPFMPTAAANAHTLSAEMALGRSPMPPLPSGGLSQRPSRQISVPSAPIQISQTGPIGMGPQAATGPRQLVPLVAPVSYPSAPVGFGPSNTASSPRFQYPNGVMAPLPAAERRRFLIGILGIAFVAVGAGIVMALVHGGGDEVADARGPTARQTQTAVASPSPPQPGAGAAPVAPTTEAAAPVAGTQPATPPAVADLRGERELRPADFGTDEQFLSGVAGGAEAATEPGRTGDEVAIAEPADNDDDEARARERRERRRERRERRREEAELAGSTIDSRDNSGAIDVPDDDPDTGDGPTVSATTALRQAEALYKQKRFTEAANILRRAIDTAGRRDVGRLRTLATNYAKIGQLLNEGQASTVSDAPRALQAFKSALRLDEEFGDSEHDRTIGARIAQVAPAAAAAYMARKDYPEAKAAADIAEKFGSGDADRVRIVRSSLERKAEQLYEEARSQAASGETEGAAQTARIILRMVPRSSNVYAKAAKLAGQ